MIVIVALIESVLKQDSFLSFNNELVTALDLTLARLIFDGADCDLALPIPRDHAHWLSLLLLGLKDHRAFKIHKHDSTAFFIPQHVAGCDISV